MTAYVRRSIDLPSRSGKGQVALLDFGDQSRPIDIVFSHANGFNALTYRHILAPLATGLRIVAYDLRGHGHTTLPADPDNRPDWTDLRDDLLALLDQLAIDHPVVLSGHSFGGTFSLMVARQAPEKVASLVLFDPVLFPLRAGIPAGNSPLIEGALRRRTTFDSREAAIASWRGRGAFANWPDEMLVDYATDGLLDAGDGVRLACSPAWEASSYRAQGQDGVAILLAVAQPTRVLKAQLHSTCAIEPEDARLVANRLIRMTKVEDTTHFLPMERPDLARAMLSEAFR